MIKDVKLDYMLQRIWYSYFLNTDEKENIVKVSLPLSAGCMCSFATEFSTISRSLRIHGIFGVGT